MEQLGDRLAAWAMVKEFRQPAGGQIAVILDSNNNLQLVTNGNGGTVGRLRSHVGHGFGKHNHGWGSDVDMPGAGRSLPSTDSTQYAFAFHAVDGSVSTAPPIAMIVGPILGASNLNRMAP